MAFTSLELNRAFPDFNRSLILDPSLCAGPDRRDLFRLVYEARTGSRSAAGELADAFEWTLKEETFEVFQKVHGPLPIGYRDWFYSKLVRFFEALVYESLSTPGLGPDGESAEPKTDQPWNEGFFVLGSKGPPVQDADVEQAFEPKDNLPAIWLPLIKSVSAARNRLGRLEQFLVLRHRNRPTKPSEARSEPGTPIPTKKREWVKNRNRNQIIRNLLGRGEDRRRICEVLDESTIEVLPVMKRHDVHSWVTAWDDPELRQNIQQLFSKL